MINYLVSRFINSIKSNYKTLKYLTCVSCYYRTDDVYLETKQNLEINRPVVQCQKNMGFRSELKMILPPLGQNYLLAHRPLEIDLKCILSLISNFYKIALLYLVAWFLHLFDNIKSNYVALKCPKCHLLINEEHWTMLLLKLMNIGMVQSAITTLNVCCVIPYIINNSVVGCFTTLN